MILSYLKDGNQFQTDQSNQDLILEEKNNQNRKTITLTALTPIELISAEITIPAVFHSNDLYFMNGYQSWTETKEFIVKEKLHNLDKLPKKLERMFAFKNYGSQSFYPLKSTIKQAFDLAYIRGENSLFVGSYNYLKAYLVITFDFKNQEIHLLSDIKGREVAKNESFVLFDYLMTNKADSIEEYCASMTAKTHEKLFGYTSWYNHYQNINEEKIVNALEEADERFDLFQIDDGFEPYVGDWLQIDEKKFPKGLEPIVKKIHDKNMKAGIWLAPFVAERKSSIVEKHPDWFPKDADGVPILAGANWSGFYPLDLNNPEVISYIKEFLNYYVSIGFDFFKLDFLYACNLYPLKGKTKAETSDFAYSLVSEVLKNKYILGCGAILSSANEKFDFMRIGPDVSLIFDDVFYMRLFHPERISTKVTLGNTVFRSPMNGHAFQNDPDVFLLRDDNIHLSWKQRYALTKMNALFGSLFMTSDNPKEYDDIKKTVLEHSLEIFRGAKDLKYRREGDEIRVTYTLDTISHAFTYHLQKGIITDER